MYSKGKCAVLVFCCAFFLVAAALDVCADDTGEIVKLRRVGNIGSLGGTELKNPVSMFRDGATGEFYLVDKDLNTVFVLNSLLAPVFSLGARHGIDAPVFAVSRGDRIYVAMENRNGLAVFNYRGEARGVIEFPDGAEFIPGAMDVGPDGSLYVINKKSGLCYVIDASDKVARVIGRDKAGNAPSGVVGVAAGRDHVFLFTPFSGAHAIAVYDRKGEFLFNYEGIIGAGGTLRMPVAGKVDAKGRVWVVDAMAGIVVYRIGNTAEVESLGSFPPPGEVLDFPVSVDFDDQGMVYILENGARRISIFKK